MKRCMFIASAILAAVLFYSCEPNKPTQKTEAVKVFDTSTADAI